MKAMAVFPVSREVKLVEHEEPQLTEPTHIKLRMLEVGVCGTDKEICEFAFGSPPQGFDYFIIGHEALGEVVAVGAAVRTVQPGDLVVLSVRRPCTHTECRPCRAGLQDYCSTQEYTERGIKAAHGFMTEYVVEDEQYAYRLPLSLRAVGVLVEPLTIAEKGIAQAWQMQQRLPWGAPGAVYEERGRGLNAVVLGAGPVGLLGAMLLRATGFETYVYSRSQAPNPKSRLVEAIGAHYLSSEITTATQLAAQIGNIDLVYEAAGAPPVAFDVLSKLGTNGVFVFTSVPDKENSSQIDTYLLVRDVVARNQVILGTVNAGRDDFNSAINDLSLFTLRWPDAVRSLITSHNSLEDARNVLLGKVSGIKNVITLDRVLQQA